MHGVLLNSYREFIEVLEAHTAFLPDNTLLDNNVIDTVILEERRLSHAIQVCFLLHIKKIYLTNKLFQK